MEVWWASEISLSSLISDNLQSKPISKLKTARLAKQRVESWINQKYPSILDYRQYLE